MKILLSPQDVLFFRDAIPMAAGVGKGAGCRLPLPNVLHEAFRSALLAESAAAGKSVEVKKGRRGGLRGDSQIQNKSRKVSSVAFASLRTIGPFPYLPDKGALFPMPLDVSVNDSGLARPLSLLLSTRYRSITNPAAYTPPCLAVSAIPPEKNPTIGWWTTSQWESFCDGNFNGMTASRTELLWKDESRIGLEIDSASQTSAQGQLYSGTFLRPAKALSFAAEVWLVQPEKDDPIRLDELTLIKLGGEGRLGFIRKTDWSMPAAPQNASRSQLVAWTLVTPSVFSQGWLPGWLCDTRCNSTPRPVGEVCLKLARGKAWLAAVCAGRPLPFSGWDLAEAKPKPTQLAVPAGSTYTFIAENPETATDLVGLLHAKPRSDAYGEKGFGYGFCRYVKALHAASAGGIPALIQALTQTNRPSTEHQEIHA